MELTPEQLLTYNLITYFYPDKVFKTKDIAPHATPLVATKRPELENPMQEVHRNIQTLTKLGLIVITNNPGPRKDKTYQLANL